MRGVLSGGPHLHASISMVEHCMRGPIIWTEPPSIKRASLEDALLGSRLRVAEGPSLLAQCSVGLRKQMSILRATILVAVKVPAQAVSLNRVKEQN
jgi:hypothetical protein